MSLRRVLVVDDEPLPRRLAEHVLQEHYEVTAVDNGQKALELLASNDYDVLITDFEIPVMKGFELLSKALAVKPTLACLMVSGNVEMEGQNWLHAVNIEFLEKPYKPQALLRKIERLLGES